jgi:serine/threonine protein kinase
MPIAGGGMADIYLAVMTGPYGFQKTVALKLMHKQLSPDRSFMGMFIDEAMINARLVHPNIVQILDFGEIDKTLYIAMEYINGIDLSEFINALINNRIMPQINVSIYIVTEILKAIHHTSLIKDLDGNSAGIVHRDITPHNILLSFDGDVKLTDFGIAKARGSMTTTVAGTLKGKLRYMSPEQARGEALDYRSDLYSIALILYELLTHRQAYAGGTDMTLLKHVQASMIDCPPSKINPFIPPELETIVVKALSAMPSDRFQTPETFQQSLHDVYTDAVSSRAILSDLIKGMFGERMKRGLVSDTPFVEKKSADGNKIKGIRLKATATYLFMAILILGCFMLFAYIKQPVPYHKTLGTTPSVSNPLLEIKTARAVLKENKVLQESALAPNVKNLKLLNSVRAYHPEHTTHKIGSNSHATVAINAVPWAQVYIADAVSKKFVGITPIPQYKIQSGKCTLLFKNKAYGMKILSINISAGEKKTIILKYDPEKKDFKTTIL